MIYSHGHIFGCGTSAEDAGTRGQEFAYTRRQLVYFVGDVDFAPFWAAINAGRTIRAMMVFGGVDSAL